MTLALKNEIKINRKDVNLHAIVHHHYTQLAIAYWAHVASSDHNNHFINIRSDKNDLDLVTRLYDLLHCSSRLIDCDRLFTMRSRTDTGPCGIRRNLLFNVSFPLRRNCIVILWKQLLSIVYSVLVDNGEFISGCQLKMNTIFIGQCCSEWATTHVLRNPKLSCFPRVHSFSTSTCACHWNCVPDRFARANHSHVMSFCQCKIRMCALRSHRYIR